MVASIERSAPASRRGRRPASLGRGAARALAIASCLVLGAGVGATAYAQVDRVAPRPAQTASPATSATDAGGTAAIVDQAAGEPKEPLAEEPLAGTASQSVQTPRYRLEGVEFEGNSRTKSRVLRTYVPLRRGDLIDPSAGQLDAIKWRLRGTGWFSEVDLRLRKGSRRGWVVLVIHVREQNTITVQQLVLGIADGLQSAQARSGHLGFYLGAAVQDSNLAGLGLGLTTSFLVSRQQQGARLDFVAPHVRASPFALRASAFFNNAREFFGTDPLFSVVCGPGSPADCNESLVNAVVAYRRGGISLGTGRDVGWSLRYHLAWQGEVVQTRSMPDAASEVRGTEVRGIDFAIARGRSYVSLLRLGFDYDRRDDPAMPTRGVRVRLDGDFATRLIGSDYDFLRVSLLARYWVPLPWHHTLRLSAFAGAVFGEAPFFYKFHAVDLTDLRPSRILEMQLDRRAPPNLLGTSIEAMRAEDLAARLDVEYIWPVYRTRDNRGVRGVELYLNVGVYGLGSPLAQGGTIPGYHGFSKVPIDLTFDLGLRADTTIGVFQVGLSNVLGFIDFDTGSGR